MMLHERSWIQTSIRGHDITSDDGIQEKVVQEELIMRMKLLYLTGLLKTEQLYLSMLNGEQDVIVLHMT